MPVPNIVHRLTFVTLLFGLPSLLVGQASGEIADYVKSHYTKYEYKVAMRDGVKLFTSVYVPKDTSKTYPLLLKRTPYSVRPYGTDQYPSVLGPSELFTKDGFIFVYQDVRGRWMSEGKFVHMRPHLTTKTTKKQIDESTDTWDTVQWLIDNISNHNGRVGIAGISYPGFYTAAGIIDSHPAIKAASPQAPVNDWFMGDDWHHNGAFFLAHAFNWMARNGRYRPEPTKNFPRVTFDYGTPDGYEFYSRIKTLSEIDTKYLKGDVHFWFDMMEHDTYDEFWQARNIRPHLKNIKPAVMTVGGWFDAENLFGAIETYKYIEKLNPKTANTLVMGPWRHGGWARGTGASFGDIPFNSNTSEFYRREIELPFFQQHLKQNIDAKLPEAWVFETGTNQWRRFEQWPPKAAQPKSLFFHSQQKLSFSSPQADKANAPYDQYVSDPQKPVPYMGEIVTGMKAEYLIADQRFAARRPDVLVYQTEVLEHDLTIIGPIEIELHVSTSGTDSDWVVKLIDVYPDDFPNPEDNSREIQMGSYQQLVRGDVIRGKFRVSFETPKPFVPDQPTVVRFTMPDTHHCFRSDHRLMIQIQSSWFPLVDRNPQKFCDIFKATTEDYQSAVQRLFHSTDKPSHIKVLVLP